jgi:tRNA(fMet)-specific endonuclease VapC
MNTLSLLDSDTLSERLKGKNPVVSSHVARYLAVHHQLAVSAITRFEIRRGPMHRNATSQLITFDQFCQNEIEFPINDAVLDCACDLWVHARRAGLPHIDADLLIAATALAHSRTLVTGNTSHFTWVPGLTVDWRMP